MNTISVDILNPASLSLLEELEKLQFITNHKRNSDFMDLVQRLRSKAGNVPSLEEITAEVEQQRAEMYAIPT
jgi:hypothetical protein